MASVCPASQLPQDDPLSLGTYQDTNLSFSNTHGALGPHDESYLQYQPFAGAQSQGAASYNLLDMPPEIYDAFLQAEPISVTMDPGFDIN